VLTTSSFGSRRSSAVLSQRAYTEGPIPPLVEEETPLPSSDVGEGIDTDRKEIA
jgi:hypothetical protein